MIQFEDVNRTYEDLSYRGGRTNQRKSNIYRRRIHNQQIG